MSGLVGWRAPRCLECYEADGRHPCSNLACTCPTPACVRAREALQAYILAAHQEA